MTKFVITSPVWVEKEVVIALHKAHLAEFGGKEGFVSEAMLDSALAKPINRFNYASPENFSALVIATLASSYAFGIIKNHPFIDGNKRTSLIVCLLFLRLNGYSLNSNEEEKYDIFMRLASNELSEKELSVWLENNLSELPESFKIL